MFEKSLIVRSGQMWKIVLAYILLFGGLACAGAGLFQLTQSPDSLSIVLLVLIGPLVAIAGGAFACFTVRCQRCGAPWLWWAVSRQNSGEWVLWLMSLAVCPNCGDNPGETTS